MPRLLKEAFEPLTTTPPRHPSLLGTLLMVKSREESNLSSDLYCSLNYKTRGTVLSEALRRSPQAASPMVVLCHRLL